MIMGRPQSKYTILLVVHAINPVIEAVHAYTTSEAMKTSLIIDLYRCKIDSVQQLTHALHTLILLILLKEKMLHRK